jgi:hypothetical protein
MTNDHEQAEIDNPTPRKEVDGQLQNFPTRIGLPVLGDFGSAEWGEEQTDAMRSHTLSARQRSFLNFFGVTKLIFGTSPAA